MSKNISTKKVMAAAISGISIAQHSYKEWTGSKWLWEAPEYLSTICVAQELSKVVADNSWLITLENGVKQALQDAGAVGRGRLHHQLRPDGRFDMLLWCREGYPKVPIEIKCQVTDFKKIKDDCNRIQKVIHRKKDESTFQFGMIVFYTSTAQSTAEKAEKMVIKRIENIKIAVKEHVGKSSSAKVVSSPITVVGESAWAAVAIALKPL